uniref:Uncharacterized protein n=1 Tax=Ditylenchus dipsaci TaxID=166011 RepID=A0A915D885_9BILA
MELKYYFRGWIAFEIVQILGTMFTLMRNSKSIESALFTPGYHLTISFSQLLMLNSLQNLFVKSLLFYHFENQALHLVHFLLNLSYSGYVLLQVFYLQIFVISAATMLQLCFTGFSLLLNLLTYFSTTSRVQEDEPRPRKLIAKHFMEPQMFGKEILRNNINKKTQ